LIDYNEINFAHYLSFKTVLTIQKPDKIIVHCNCDQLQGSYWTKLKDEFKNIDNKVTINRVEKPQTIYGTEYSKDYQLWHSSDILRIKVCFNPN